VLKREVKLQPTNQPTE